jgi:hypothetical protein
MALSITPLVYGPFVLASAPWWIDKHPVAFLVLYPLEPLSLLIVPKVSTFVFVLVYFMSRLFPMFPPFMVAGSLVDRLPERAKRVASKPWGWVLLLLIPGWVTSVLSGLAGHSKRKFAGIAAVAVSIRLAMVICIARLGKAPIGEVARFLLLHRYVWVAVVGGVSLLWSVHTSRRRNRRLEKS